MKTKEEILKVISEVKHPAIDYSLVDLGMIKDIEIDDTTVSLTFVFPFPKIPIAESLINSIATPLKNIGYTLVPGIILMTDEEKAKFTKMETDGWKG
jgi:metal-sulfur cluster biosynthetic enzyme